MADNNQDPEKKGKNRMKVTKKEQTNPRKGKSIKRKSRNNTRDCKNMALEVRNRKRNLRSSCRGNGVKNMRIGKSARSRRSSAKISSTTRKPDGSVTRKVGITRRANDGNLGGRDRRSTDVCRCGRRVSAVSSRGSASSRRRNLNNGAETGGQTRSTQRDGRSVPGTSEQIATEIEASTVRRSRTRSETVTSGETMESSDGGTSNNEVAAQALPDEGSGSNRELDASDEISYDVRMARREFMREMELVGREIGRLVEVVGRDFIREMEEAEREAGRESTETTRGFQVVLRDARRMLEERVTDIANQMIANVSSSSQRRSDLSRSELWNRATSVLRDARHSEELGSWIADAILGVGLGGLSEAEVNRLPSWSYSSAASRKASANLGNRSLSKKCQICLSDYMNGNLIRTLPCFHDFHAPCVDRWLKSSRTCPSCRYEVSFDD